MAERTFKSIVFEVLPDAIDEERSPSGKIDSRGLFYAVRRLYNAHPERPFEKERKKAQRGQGEPLAYGYFNGEMLHHFEDRHGEIEGLSREPRGHLFEAHTEDDGTPQEIGTAFAAEFEPPPYYYDTVLFCEKHGFAQVLVDEGLGQRYDMANIASKGYRTQADIRFLEKLSDEGYEILVLHDCDPDGYGIFATLRGGSILMPDLFVPAVDLGMSLEDARAFDPPLLGEDATRQKAIPERTLPYLSEDEREMFTGTRRGNVWEYQRIELNEIPAHERVGFVETKLSAAGLTAKVVPPQEFLSWRAANEVSSDQWKRVRLAISEIIDEQAINAAVREEFEERYGVGDTSALAESIYAAFYEDPSDSWRDVLDSKVTLAGYALRAEITAAVRRLLAEQFGEDSDGS
jgi:hypothetical protein